MEISITGQLISASALCSFGVSRRPGAFTEDWKLETGLLGDLCPSGRAAEGPVRYTMSVYTSGHLSLDQKCTCDATSPLLLFPMHHVHVEPSQSPQALPFSDGANIQDALCP